MSITIGPVHIADADGTHEPGAVIDNPSPALTALADAAALEPQSGLPYAVHTPVAAPAAKATPKPEPEPVAAATPAEEAV